MNGQGELIHIPKEKVTDTVVFACEGHDDFLDKKEKEMALLAEYKAIGKPEELMRRPVPNPSTGLVPCGWCGPERIGWFSVQFWVRASTGKRKWMSVTQQYKKQVNFCPMCGRKLEVEE